MKTLEIAPEFERVDDIVRDVLDDMSSAATPEQATPGYNKIMEVVDSFELEWAHDLQFGKIEELKYRRDTLLAELRDDSFGSLVKDMRYMNGMYAGRMIRQNTFGQPTTEFITRDAKTDTPGGKVDAYYCTTGLPNYSPQITIESSLKGALETPVIFVATNGLVKVMQNIYRRGRYERVEFHPDKSGRVAVLRMALSAANEWAITETTNRDAATREAADAQALIMLSHFKRQRTTC